MRWIMGFAGLPSRADRVRVPSGAPNKGTIAMKYWIQFSAHQSTLSYNLFTTNSVEEEEAVPTRCYRIPKLVWLFLDYLRK